ncbi:MAG: hypothetical protein A2Y97_04945 [Nitrospirae bacterium RBG_13_39_12]|nr:MAG: hypothetical protein A2Y97_04945 [Nitrospirae bacterium RBG_13_39_12]
MMSRNFKIIVLLKLFFILLSWKYIAFAASPTLIGSYNGNIQVDDVALSNDGKKAFITGWTGDEKWYGDNFQILDLTDPVVPRLLGSLSKPPLQGLSNIILTHFITLSSDEQRAYVSIFGVGLLIIDISNPTAPKLLGQYNPPQGIGFKNTVLSDDGTIAFVSASNFGLHILDVSNPSLPTVLGIYDLHEAGVIALTPDKEIAYLPYDKLRMLDVSDPTSPQLIGTFDVGEEGVYLSSDGTRAYLGCGGFFYILNINKPTSPKILGKYNTFYGDSYNDIALSNDEKIAYLAGRGLRIIDISDPTHPTLIDEVINQKLSKASGIAISPDGGLAYIAGGSYGLRIVDVSPIYEPDILVSPRSHGFGSVKVGNSSTPKVFTISNTGKITDLVIDNLSLVETNKSNFAIQNDSCSGQTIAPLSHCTVEILFTPKSAGPKSASLSVSSNDPETPLMTMPISGTGLVKLTVEKTGTGRGTVVSEDGLIDCGKDCIQTYNDSIVVMLKAIAVTGSAFAGWLDACTGTITCTVTTNVNKIVTAKFNLLPPMRPSSLTAKAISSSQIVLTWKDNSTNESGFQIESKSGACDSANTWSQIAMKGVNITTYTNAGLTPSTVYSYRVLAYNSAGNSAYSNCESAKTALSGTPKAPTNLEATSLSSSQIELTWSDNSTNEKSFKVYRKVGTGSWSLLATEGANAVNHTDTTATGNASTTVYSYYIQACNNNGCSPKTNTTVVPYRPTNLSVTAVSPSEINLMWIDKSNNETGFEIYGKYDKCSSVYPWSKIKTWSRIITVGPDVNSYGDTGLLSGSTYSYKVRAYSRSAGSPYAYGYSLYSNCSSATTP